MLTVKGCQGFGKVSESRHFAGADDEGARKFASDADLSAYDVVFLGSPNWWGTVSTPVRAFIAKHDFTGKIVIPFFTHGGGGMQNCEKDMVKLVSARGARTLPGKTAYGTFASVLPSAYMGWLKDCGFGA